MPNQTNQEQILEITADFNFLKAAATTEGFFKLYFEALPKHRTQVECFNAINERYYDLVGEYKFSEYRSFMNSVRLILKDKNK